MHQWNSSTAYWPQSFAQTSGTGCVQAAQTYDYNHQTVTSSPSSATATTSSTPPPPGVDSKEAISTTGSEGTMTQAPAWSAYAASGMYPYAYHQQYPYGYGSYYPPFTSAPSNDPVQAAVRWNAAAYGYYAYPGTQQWAYPPPSSAHMVSSSAPRPGSNGLRPTLPSVDPGNTQTENLQQPPATLQAKGTKEQWSDELKDYVRRAFLTVDTKEEKDQMERILKEKLEYIFRNNIKVDWAAENIPTVPSKAIAALKNAALSRPATVSVVKPQQVPVARATRFTGPARGSSLRLPVGVLSSSRGGRNVFTTSKAAPTTPRKRSPLVKRPVSRSSSEDSPDTSTRSGRRVFVPSRSRSRSRSSGRSSCSSAGVGRQKRHRRPSPSPLRSATSKSNHFYTSPACSPTSSNDSTPRSVRYQQKPGRFSSGHTAPDSKQSVSRDDNRGGRGRGRGGKQRKRGGGDNWGNSARLLSRADRFKDHLTNNESTLTGSGSIARTTSQVLLSFMDDGRDDLASEFGACQIVGTMQDLEKRYLRLTRAPEPHEVRPLAVLKLSLEHVKQKWVEKSDYHWACEQFKSIRQDLTVQGIEDDFAVAVYEAHADAALDAGDFEEFHQCQSQLLRLYNEGATSNRILEFTAYRLLYYIFTLDLLGINTIMAGLRPVHKSNPCIRFALNVRSAWSLHNYRRLFRFICPPDEADQPPLRCGQVIFWFLERERKDALKTIFKVFRPLISLQYVADLIRFASVEECKHFICGELGVSEDLFGEDKVDCKLVWNAMCQGSQ